MELEPTFPASERRTFPVSFVGMPTYRALLRGVSGINEDNLLSQSLSLVLKKLFKFVERPVVQFPVELLTSPFLNPDLREVFESEDRVIRVHNLLRDTMVSISHKPFFPSGDPAEFPLCRPGAFGLQLLTKMSVFRPYVLHRFGVEKSVVRADCDIHDPSVDPEHLNLRYRFHVWMLHRDVEVKHLLSPVIGESRSRDLPGEVLAMILRDRERRFDPSSHRCNGRKTMHQVHRDDPLVVSHSGKRLSFWQGLTLHGFQGLTRAITRTLHQRGREIRNRLTNTLVSCLVVLHLVPHMVLEPPLCRGRERDGIGPHRIEESSRATFRQLEFERDCPNHIHILIMIVEKCNGGDGQFLPGLKTGVSLPI